MLDHFLGLMEPSGEASTIRRLAVRRRKTKTATVRTSRVRYHLMSGTTRMTPTHSKPCIDEVGDQYVRRTSLWFSSV